MIFLSMLACSTIIVGRDVSTTGRVIVGHNEDDSGDITVQHAILNGVYWSEVREGGKGLPNADVFYNDRGVAVVSNNGMGAGPDEPAAELRDGGVGYALRCEVAEKAGSAREALSIVTNLVMRYGYSMPGRNYTVADKDEAWLIEIVKGSRFVARRCPDDQITVIANGYTIRKLEPGDIVAPAVAARANGNPKFDFTRTYLAKWRYRSPSDTFRWKHMLRIMTGFEFESDDYPFSSPAKEKVGVDRVRAALSSHYEGTEDEVKPKHGEDLPRLKAGLPICRASTVECTLFEFAADPHDTVISVATGSPCKTQFRTFRPFNGGLPADIDRSADAAERLAEHRRSLGPSGQPR